MSMLSMRALVKDCLIGIVDTNDLIGLIDPLAWGGTPAIEDRNFLSHILTGLGTAKGKLLFLNTLSWNDASLRDLLLHHHSILHWGCNHHGLLLLHVGALTWTCTCLHHLRLGIGLGSILLSSKWRRYLELILIYYYFTTFEVVVAGMTPLTYCPAATFVVYVGALAA